MINPQLDGKTALVTGGASGMGAEISLELAEAGAKVIIADLDKSGAQRVAAKLPQGASYAVDLGSADSVQTLIDAIASDGHQIDVLVCAAGWDEVAPFLEADPKLWDKLIGINYRSQVQLTHALLPYMRESGWGRIIYIGSDAGRVGSSGEAVYAGCKAALAGFGKTIAREFSRDGITANVVSPGPTDTPMLQEVAKEHPKRIEALKRVIPVGRLGTASDISAAVAFLAGDRAGFITGQILSVSGGLTMS